MQVYFTFVHKSVVIQDSEGYLDVSYIAPYGQVALLALLCVIWIYVTFASEPTVAASPILF